MDEPSRLRPEPDQPLGFLESAFERALAVREEAPADGKVVPIVAPLRSQATLRERDRRFRELLESLPAAVYTTDTAGRITYYNASVIAPDNIRAANRWIVCTALAKRRGARGAARTQRQAVGDQALMRASISAARRRCRRYSPRQTAT